MTAIFLVVIAKKESNGGKHVPRSADGKIVIMIGNTEESATDLVDGRIDTFCIRINWIYLKKRGLRENVDKVVRIMIHKVSKNRLVVLVCILKNTH
ncbi:MAG: hypothetical protein ACSLEX_03275 [Minisyncoccota bacterium]